MQCTRVYSSSTSAVLHSNMTDSIHRLFFVTLAITNSIALPSHAPSATSRTHTTIISTTSNCDSNSINVTLLLVQPFSGVFFAKEFSQGCRTFGNSSRSLILNLPTSGCGVSLNEEEKTQRLYYRVAVILQQDKFLRQISDENKLIKCYLPDDSFQVKSSSMERTLKTLIPDINRRKGRMKQHWNDESKISNDRILTDALLASKAWMEIVPAEHTKRSGVLKVGEPALLVVKSTLPVGIGWRVVDCIAHDGLGDSSQLLLDQDGCPIDELLLPALLKKPAKPIALMKHQEAVSKFAAFKFPDRDRLHLTCSLQLCKNACPQV
ncbi:cypher isoform b [Holotrichia oblita]|uniref:Cypher isoform b n=1 Tax=Holotrichia oblita TaxID=644536 RepID=A0ACB9TMG2_HOLOL|nr:cypher isoform b [Holotrichia oblita]